MLSSHQPFQPRVCTHSDDTLIKTCHEPMPLEGSEGKTLYVQALLEDLMHMYLILMDVMDKDHTQPFAGAFKDGMWNQEP